MEGGIAILLLLIIVAVAAVIGAALYFTGGALWFGKTSPKGDQVEGAEDGRFGRRPEHKEVTSETIENTHVVGTRDDER
jgi:hypothetical protein